MSDPGSTDGRGGASSPDRDRNAAEWAAGSISTVDGAETGVKPADDPSCVIWCDTPAAESARSTSMMARTDVMVGRSDGAFCFLSKRGVLLDSGKKVPRRPRASGEGKQDATITAQDFTVTRAKRRRECPEGTLTSRKDVFFDLLLHLFGYYN